MHFGENLILTVDTIEVRHFCSRRGDLVNLDVNIG